ncbi:hypothetical protein BDV11DRAFT_110062 [Aspergillus similis]
MCYLNSFYFFRLVLSSSPTCAHFTGGLLAALQQGPSGLLFNLPTHLPIPITYTGITSDLDPTPIHPHRDIPALWLGSFSFGRILSALNASGKALKVDFGNLGPLPPDPWRKIASPVSHRLVQNKLV